MSHRSSTAAPPYGLLVSRPATCWFIASALLVAIATSACDRSRDQAREALEQWLRAHVAGDFDRVVALTADVTFAEVARRQQVPLARVRADMPKLLALAPEKLTGYRLEGDGRKVGEGHYVFSVVQDTVKQGRPRQRKEQVHLVLEGEIWRVDPTRTGS